MNTDLQPKPDINNPYDYVIYNAPLELFQVQKDILPMSGESPVIVMPDGAFEISHGIVIGLLSMIAAKMLGLPVLKVGAVAAVSGGIVTAISKRKFRLENEQAQIRMLAHAKL